MSVSPPALVPASAPTFCLSLHIRHPSLEPAQISRELQLTAEEAIGAGEPRERRGAPAGVHGETYWVARLDPTFWRRLGFLRTFDPVPPIAAPEPADEAPRSHLQRLIEHGRLQGYLTHRELREQMPEAEGAQMEALIKSLEEEGIPVHAQESAQLATLQRLRGYDARGLLMYLESHPGLQLSDVLALVCLRLARQHSAFLQKLRIEGGSVRLLVTLSSRAIQGFSIPPELSARLGELGIQLDLALAAASARARPRP